MFNFNELGVGSNGEQNKTNQATNFRNREYFLTTVISSHGISSGIMIFRYYIGYLNCTKIHIILINLNNPFLQDFQLVQLNHCPYY